MLLFNFAGDMESELRASREDQINARSSKFPPQHYFLLFGKLLEVIFTVAPCMLLQLFL
jgi:hypothetical protein